MRTQKGRKFATTSAIENVFEAFKMRLNVAKCVALLSNNPRSPLPLCMLGTRAKGYTICWYILILFFLLVAMRLCGHVDDAFVNVHACLCWCWWVCVDWCVSVCVGECVGVLECVWACGFAKMHPAVGCLHLTIKQLVRGAKSICNCCSCACVCVSLCECVQFLGMFQPVVARPNT